MDVTDVTTELPQIPAEPVIPERAAPARASRRARIAAAVPWSVVASTGAWISGIVLLCVALAAGWWFVQPQLTKPFVYDEAAFAFGGRAVAETGLPYSNVGHIQEETPGDFSKRFNWALWHPPLYLYLLGFAFRQWGETEMVARALGVACNGLVAIVLFLIGTLAFAGRTRAAPVYAALGSLLYTTNPLVQQSALLLDIDGTVLVASIALLTLAYVLLFRSNRPLRHPATWLLLGLVTFCFALSLWAKMTTALALLAVAAVYRLLMARPWRPWRALVELPVVAIVGSALFLVSWAAFAAWNGMPFWFPFRILQLEFAESAGSTDTWRSNPAALLELVSHVALWVSPYLMALFVCASLIRAFDLVIGPVVALARRALQRPITAEPWGARPIDFVLGCGAVIGAAYLIKEAGSFPKYHISMMPFWALGAAYVVSRYVKRLEWWEIPAYAVVVSGMAGYFVSFVGDQHVLFRGWGFVTPLLGWPAALGLAFLVLSFTLGRHNLPRQLTILGVMLTLAWSWGVDLAQSQANYSTAYNYGTAGQTEAAAYLNTVLRPEQPYVAAREVAYYAKDQVFVDQDVFWAHIEDLSRRGVTTFDGTLLGYKLDVLALFLWDPTLGQIAHSYLDDKYEVAFQSLPYIVFVRTAP
jgi:hypothetical protein